MKKKSRLKWIESKGQWKQIKLGMFEWGANQYLKILIQETRKNKYTVRIQIIKKYPFKVNKLLNQIKILIIGKEIIINSNLKKN
jgi:hypothetical protein